MRAGPACNLLNLHIRAYLTHCFDPAHGRVLDFPRARLRKYNKQLRHGTIAVNLARKTHGKFKLFYVHTLLGLMHGLEDGKVSEVVG